MKDWYRFGRYIVKGSVEQLRNDFISVLGDNPTLKATNEK